MSLVRVVNISKTYRLGSQDVYALKEVSLDVKEGVFLAIAGPSGSGKSTLLNMIGCIDTPTSGHITINGRELTGKTPDELANVRARTIGFIFQTFNLLPVLSAEENIEYPLLQFPELNKKDRRRRVEMFLDVVKLSKFGKHRPNEMSGGQRQRVAIARALATNSKIVLADEPTANLDHATGNSILELMREINRSSGTTFIFSTHDQRVMNMADHLVRLEDGVVTAVAKRGMNTKWVIVNDRPIDEEDDPLADPLTHAVAEEVEEKLAAFQNQDGPNASAVNDMAHTWDSARQSAVEHEAIAKTLTTTEAIRLAAATRISLAQSEAKLKLAEIASGEVKDTIDEMFAAQEKIEIEAMLKIKTMKDAAIKKTATGMTALPAEGKAHGAAAALSPELPPPNADSTTAK
uniref:LolD lipoprotein releasing system, ATP-binding protein n=1 Tax=uncultured bacterium CSL142 TaxID=1091569 RepID=G4WVN0_9BACT|nr:LolD lipoprotein releasing system, ATP-binding protein [uncultured bacterium CSL142]